MQVIFIVQTAYFLIRKYFTFINMLRLKSGSDSAERIRKSY